MATLQAVRTSCETLAIEGSSFQEGWVLPGKKPRGHAGGSHAGPPGSRTFAAWAYTSSRQML